MMIILNGESRPVDPGSTLRSLVEQLGFSCDKVAIERNRRLVRGEYESVLTDGDEIEIVTFVGGG